MDSTELITTREELEQCLKHRGPAKGTRELADSHIEPFAFLCQFLAADALSHSGSRDLHSKPPGAETYTPTTLLEELARHFFHFGLRELAKK